MTQRGYFHHLPPRLLAVLAIGIPICAPLSFAATTGTLASGERQALLKQYCLTCHNSKTKSGGMVLEGVAPDQPALHPDVWERVHRKLQAGEMPPSGMPRPPQEISGAFVASLVHDLDAAARNHPYAGRPVIRRLNRFEYAN